MIQVFYMVVALMLQDGSVEVKTPAFQTMEECQMFYDGLPDFLDQNGKAMNLNNAQYTKCQEIDLTAPEITPEKGA